MGSIPIRDAHGKEFDFLVDIHGTVKTDLQILQNWSLSEIRLILEKHKKCCYGVRVSRREFTSLLSLESYIGQQIYADLVGPTDYGLNIYEIVVSMSIMAHANFYNKVRFIFNTVTLTYTDGIEFEEMYLLVLSLVYGYGRFIGKEGPERDMLKEIAMLIFSAADYSPDNKLTVSELGSWVEINSHIMDLLKLYEPLDSIEEKLSNFVPYHPNVTINDILTAFTNEKESAPYKGSSVNEEFKCMRAYKRSQMALITKPTKNKIRMITINGKSYSQKEVIFLKKYFDSINTSKSGKMSLEEYCKAASKVPYLKRIAVSLYHFLDKRGKGEVTFEEFLLKTANGAKKSDIKQMMEWVKEEEILKGKAQANYKEDESSDIGQETSKGILTPKDIKDFLHLFVDHDKKELGKLDLEDLMEAYKRTLSPETITNLLKEFDRDGDGYLNLEEFLQMIFTDAYLVSQELILDFAVPYIMKIRTFQGLKPYSNHLFVRKETK